MTRLATHFGFWNANYSRTSRRAVYGPATLELLKPELGNERRPNSAEKRSGLSIKK